MIVETNVYKNGTWEKTLDNTLDSQNTLIMVFGCSDFSKIESGFRVLREHYPQALVIGCSSAGEIYEEELLEDSMSIAITKFEKTTLKLSSVSIADFKDSKSVATHLVQNCDTDNLKALFVLSDGLHINGSQLTEGFNSMLSKEVIITGGLAGDDARFEQTWVLVDDKPMMDYVTAVGFYGDFIHVNYGSKGGWNKFGIDREVTLSKENVLYELDHKPALEIYKTYLGEQAKELPASGLLFPLVLKDEKGEEKVRTILAVDEKENSITFAGDIPIGATTAFMRANFDNLIDGAQNAAEGMLSHYDATKPALNIAISCVGRKLVLKQRTEDEIEVIKDVFEGKVAQVGFYSYGEISPLHSGKCDLHNQTMTLTLIQEF